jgi:hypothetical protein
MNRLRHPFLLALLACPLWATADGVQSASPEILEFAPAPEAWSVEILEQDAGGTTVEFRLNRLGITAEAQGHRLLVEGLSPSLDPGLPELPAWSGVFAVPPRAGLGLQVLESETRTLAGIHAPCRRGLAKRPPGQPPARPPRGPRRSTAAAAPPGRPNPRATGPRPCGTACAWCPWTCMPLRWQADTGELTVYTRLLSAWITQGDDRRNLRTLEQAPVRAGPPPRAARSCRIRAWWTSPCGWILSAATPWAATW